MGLEGKLPFCFLVELQAGRREGGGHLILSIFTESVNVVPGWYNFHV